MPSVCSARQQSHVGIGTASRYIIASLTFFPPQLPGLVKTGGTRGYICFETDYGLDSRFTGSSVELVGTKKIAVISDGNCGLTDLFRAFHQFPNPSSSIQHGIVGMNMKMNKIFRWSHAPQFSLAPALFLARVKLLPMPALVSLGRAWRVRVYVVAFSNDAPLAQLARASDS